MKLYSQGAAEEVTGSKHLLETEKGRIMIDCGVFQGKRAEADKKNRDWTPETEGLDAVVLTHGHYDHCGLLPLLCKEGFDGNIFSTSATRDIANLIMMDSAKIQARDAEWHEKQARKRGEKFDWKPLYDENDVMKATNQFVSLSYRRKMLISRDIEITFFDAGHILGSSMVYCELERDGGAKSSSRRLPWNAPRI